MAPARNPPVQDVEDDGQWKQERGEIELPLVVLADESHGVEDRSRSARHGSDHYFAIPTCHNANA